jgi:hypothetical protein
MPEVVSFIADTAPPLPPGVSSALRVFKWALGLMLALSAPIVALTEIGFLAGPSGMMGWPGALIIGIASALGLVILPVAAGIIWGVESLRPASIIPVAMLVPCLWLALVAAGGFAYVTSHPLPKAETPAPRFPYEPRHVKAVEHDINRWKFSTRDKYGSWSVTHTNGAEILKMTDDCTNLHLVWENSECEQWFHLQDERAMAVKVYGQAESVDLGMSSLFSPWALAFGRHHAAWYIYMAAVLFSIGSLPTIFLVSYVLTTLPVLGATPAVKADSPGNVIQQTFNAWADQCLQKANGVTVSADLIYQHHCAFANWLPGGRACGGVEALGSMMEGPLRRLEAVRTKIGKQGDTAYSGLEIRRDGLSGEILAQLRPQGAP